MEPQLVGRAQTDFIRQVTTVEFADEFFSDFIDWINRSNVRDAHGRIVELTVDRYAPGRASITATAREEP